MGLLGAGLGGRSRGGYAERDGLVPWRVAGRWGNDMQGRSTPPSFHGG